MFEVKILIIKFLYKKSEQLLKEFGRVSEVFSSEDGILSEFLFDS